MVTPKLPRRLVALAARLAATEDVFADWQLGRRASVTKVHPEGEAELVERAGRALLPFAGDFSGGVLVLDVSRGDVESAPVVAFDSEGGIAVLGESFDDFLALLASDEPDSMQDSWAAGPELAAWIHASGVAGHHSATARLVELGEMTRRFWIGWTDALRAASATLRPAAVVEHALVLGERLGEVVLGSRRDVLDAKWGAPEIPSWGVSGDHVIASYPGRPLVVELDPARERVRGVTLYKGLHRARTADGVSPLFMPASAVMEWLASLALSAVRERSAIRVPSLGVTFSLSSRLGAEAGEPWVEAIAMRELTGES